MFVRTFEMMKIGIIGCGWLGLPLALSLKKDGLDIVGTATSQMKVESLRQLGISSHLFDGTISAELKDDLSTCEWVVITVPPTKNMDYLKVLSEIFKGLNSKANVIYTSSIGVYQDVNGTVNEKSPVQQDHVVARAEAFLKLQTNQLTILRLGGLVGNDRHPVKYLAGRKDLEGAESPVNLIDREDVIHAIQVLIKNEWVGTLFNLVYPEHPSKKEYYSHMAKLKGLEQPEFKLDSRKGKLVEAHLISDLTGFTYSKSIYQS